MSCKNPRGRGSLRGGWCNKMVGELGHPQRWTILFLFHFLLLCNSLQCMGHYDSKGIHGIIRVDKYK